MERLGVSEHLPPCSQACDGRATLKSLAAAETLEVMHLEASEWPMNL